MPAVSQNKNASMTSYIVRHYTPVDRPSVRLIFGQDEFARPDLAKRYPRMTDFLADGMAPFYDEEPESCLVAVSGDQVIGALLGSLHLPTTDPRLKRNYRRMFLRCLMGAYGWPGWLAADLRTEWAGRTLRPPPIDLDQYPAHLHIGVLPEWWRQGVGSALMQAYADLLRQRGMAGYHLYASSFHPLGVAFYHRFGLETLGQFEWRFHNGHRWQTVVETIFGKRLTDESDTDY